MRGVRAWVHLERRISGFGSERQVSGFGVDGLSRMVSESNRHPSPNKAREVV